MSPLLSFLRREKPHKTPMGRTVAMLAERGIDTVLDIGANKGQTGQELRRYGYRGKIISFEPLPGPHALLQAAAKGDEQWMVAPRMAVGEQAGTVTLNQSVSTEMSSILPVGNNLVKAMPNAATEQEVEATVTTLVEIISSRCQPADRIFVKIDTQGYERQVLAGLGSLWNRVAGFHIEMSLLPLYEGEMLFDQIIALLKEHGFEAYLLYDTSFSKVLKRQLQLDGVFFRSQKA
jgi:FkbM family methyltransferase